MISDVDIFLAGVSVISYGISLTLGNLKGSASASVRVLISSSGK